MRNFLILLSVMLCSCLAACSTGSPDSFTQQAESGDELDTSDFNLPAVDGLDEMAAGLRSVSSSSTDLLGHPISIASSEGLVVDNGVLPLDGADAKTSWAIFSAVGFDPSGEIHPASIHCEFNLPMYIAFADYTTQRWRWQRLSSFGNKPISNGADLISPAGNVHVAVLAHLSNVNLSRLELNFTGEIPAAPGIQVNLAEPILAGYSNSYDFTGSSPGSAAVLTEMTIDFGDGSGKQSVAGIEQPIEHTYAQAGSYDLSVTLVNDLGYSSTKSVPVNVSEGRTELLVIANSDDPDSLELADYYMSPATGRGIAATHRLELALGEDPDPAIARADYESMIRDPIKAFLDGDFSEHKTELKYILLMEDIPHQIPGSNGNNIDLSTFSSVDSELCTLYSDGTYAYESYLWNEEDFEDFGQFTPNDASFYIGLRDLDTEYSFSHAQFRVSDGSGSEYPLDYLVGRLDAYDLATAKALVDRSLAADTTGNGWVVYDTTPARTQYDTMTDPLWPLADVSGMSGEEELAAAGFSYFIDTSTTRIIGQESDGLPEGCVGNVIAYAGWGVNHSGGSWPSGSSYILDDLLFDWLPGAAWISYESFNGTDFRSSTVDGDRSDINRKGQGQICDFLHTGGSVAIGHVYEPWTVAVGDERAVFYRYCVKGDNWIEAAYKGLRCLSWMDVVVGDPLCRVK